MKSPKLYHCDSGLACHLLGIRSAAELRKSPFLGSIGKWHLWANELGNHYDPKNSHIPRGADRLGFDGYWAGYNFHHEYYGDAAY